MLSCVRKLESFRGLVVTEFAGRLVQFELGSPNADVATSVVVRVQI